jgi:hypothetical protein
MTNTDSMDTAKLARLTGLPNLDTINDPERLERLISAAWNMLAHTTPQCPLRFEIAYVEYARLATYRLEHPDPDE